MKKQISDRERTGNKHLIAHGLANLAGAFAPWTQSMQGFKNAAWIFSGGVTFKSGVGQVFQPDLAGIVDLPGGCGMGALLQRSWWLPLGIAGCAFSLAAILPWLIGVPPGARFGAVFDIAAMLILGSPLGARIALTIQ